jgi:hypothetical protein
VEFSESRLLYMVLEGVCTITHDLHTGSQACDLRAELGNWNHELRCRGVLRLFLRRCSPQRILGLTLFHPALEEERSGFDCPDGHRLCAAEITSCGGLGSLEVRLRRDPGLGMLLCQVKSVHIRSIQ